MNNEAKILKKIMKEQGLTQTELAGEMKISRQLLNAYLQRNDDMKVSTFQEFLEYLGYRIDVVENDGIIRVSEEHGSLILVGSGKDGKYWYKDRDGAFIGIEKSGKDVRFMKFKSKENCLDYLRGNEGK